MSDSECELRRERMADSDEQPSEPNRDHEGNLNSPSHFFIDFANKAMACAPTARTIADDFHELPAHAKEKVLKGLVDEIMENLLKGLPELEKEEFLDDCFKAIYEKLPWKSQVSVTNRALFMLSTPPMTTDYYDRPSKPKSPPVKLQRKLMTVKVPVGATAAPPPSPPPSPPQPPPPELFFVDIPDTIGSGNGQGRGRGRGRGRGQEG